MHGCVKAIPLLLTLIVVASSGCISNPETFARAIPMVQEFLEQHPNAEINVVHYTAAESEDLLDLIKEDCGKLSVEPKEYYFINITDPSTNLVVRAWIDWESQLVECVYKEGTFVDPENCTALYQARCFGDHVYWFDSCGNREDKKEYCPLGCSNGQCISGRECDIDESYTEKPDCVCPDGYEMMVLYPRCADSITGAITGMPFAVTQEVADKAVTTEAGAVEIDPDFTTEFDQRCPDSRPVYRCVKRQQCRSRAQTMCYKGHVYWFDSCGHVQEKKQYCSEGCELGFCKERKSCEDMGGYCVYAATTDSVTGMPHAVEPTTTSVEYPSCRDGYSLSDDYWCPDDGLCCLPEQVCDESDDGIDIYNAGCTEAGNSRLCDHCNSDGTLTEKYCEGGTIHAKTVECPSGYVCSDAACVIEEEGCFDSDGGLEYYVKGNAEGYDGSISDECVIITETNNTVTTTGIESCSTEDNCMLSEAMCNENQGVYAEFYECPYGCEDGACLEEEECVEEGGYMQGTVSPEYQTHCCEGLEGFDTSGGLLGAPLLCYDPVKGEPSCLGAGTDDEGWYYPDESLLLKEDCSDAECTEGDIQPCGETEIGLCSYGNQTCVEGLWSECVGAVYPTDEICFNDVDEDCDGVIDNGCLCVINETVSCGETEVGVCEFGVSTCTESGWSECVGAVYPTDEICDDLLDNDCDGVIDEDCE